MLRSYVACVYNHHKRNGYQHKFLGDIQEHGSPNKANETLVVVTWNDKNTAFRTHDAVPENIPVG